MGLDMFAMVTDEKPSKPVDFDVQKSRRIHYWRKHPNLHGWMQALYYRKGGTADTFNCALVELTLEDVDLLEQDVRNQNLPVTRGMFFGESYGDETSDDLAFIAKARKAIADGMTVFYDSWW